MKLSMPMIGGVLVGLTVAMTSGIARDGRRSITFGTSAALAQEDSGEQEAAPAMPAPEPAPYQAAPAMPAAEPAPYPMPAPEAVPNTLGAEQPPPVDPWATGNTSQQLQYQQEEAVRQQQMQDQAEQYRQQQETIQQMINSQGAAPAVPAPEPAVSSLGATAQQQAPSDTGSAMQQQQELNLQQEQIQQQTEQLRQQQKEMQDMINNMRP